MAFIMVNYLNFCRCIKIRMLIKKGFQLIVDFEDYDHGIERRDEINSSHIFSKVQGFTKNVVIRTWLKLSLKNYHDCYLNNLKRNSNI